MHETQGELLPVILGGAAIGMWAEHGLSSYRTGKPAPLKDVLRGGAIGAIPSGIGAGAKGVKAIRTGKEISFGKNFRVAPLGNSTGHPIGKFPHYHRRGAINPKTGQPSPGQGISRHRPWEKSSHDKTWKDRF